MSPLVNEELGFRHGETKSLRAVDFQLWVTLCRATGSIGPSASGPEAGIHGVVRHFAEGLGMDMISAASTRAVGELDEGHCWPQNKTN